MGQQQESEWIEWAGGECPIPTDHFDARYRDGTETFGNLPTEHPKLRATLWRHDGGTDDIVAYRISTPNTPASNDFVLVQAERDRFREALEDVCNPIRHFQRMADAEGARLSGMAYSLANDISTVQRIARAALAAAPASPEPANETHGPSVIDAAAARELFLSHCKPGDRGTLERYGERAAIAAIMEAVSIQGASPAPASNEAPGRGGVEAFGAAVFRLSWDAFMDVQFDVDLERITKAAVEAGLLKVCPFDPEVHNDETGAAEPGDDFYQPTEAGVALLRAGAAA